MCLCAYECLCLPFGRIKLLGSYFLSLFVKFLKFSIKIILNVWILKRMKRNINFWMMRIQWNMKKKNYFEDEMKIISLVTFNLLLWTRWWSTRIGRRRASKNNNNGSLAFKISQNWFQFFFILFSISYPIPLQFHIDCSLILPLRNYKMKLRLIAIQLPDRSILFTNIFEFFCLFVCFTSFATSSSFSFRTSSPMPSSMFSVHSQIISANNEWWCICVCGAWYCIPQNFVRATYFLA